MPQPKASVSMALEMSLWWAVAIVGTSSSGRKHPARSFSSRKAGGAGGGRGRNHKLSWAPPSPTCDVMATCGLDHDAKIWAPTAKATTELTGLKNVSKKNKQEWDEDRMHHTYLFDDHMLWFLMCHLTQRGHHWHWRDPENVEAYLDHTSEEEENQERVQCMPSWRPHTCSS